MLSPGEMGSAVGQTLAAHGWRVVTCLAGRGEASRQRAVAAGFGLVADLDALAGTVDLVISIVPPAAAETLARSVAAAAVRTGSAPLYLDANSIGPATVARIAGALHGAAIDLVDGAIIGGARSVPQGVKFYFSGPGAGTLAEWLQPPLRVEVLGPELGQASTFKMLYAGMTKGVSALGLELLAAAELLGLRERLLQEYQADHPSIARLLASTLPELPPRARRRSQEMAELREMLRDARLPADMAVGAEATLARLADRHEADPLTDRDGLEAMLTWWIAAATLGRGGPTSSRPNAPPRQP